MKRQFVLASASPRRRELIRQIGLEAEVIPSLIEETLTQTRPDLAVEELSRQKALDVAAGMAPGTVVIGADTVVALGDEIFGKPKSQREAGDMLFALQGKTHQVYTGVTLVICGRVNETVTFSACTQVHLYPMSEQEIAAYVSSGDPLDKAGAYGIQGPFAAYVKGITGDYNNVVGLPVGRLYQEMKRLGVW